VVGGNGTCRHQSDTKKAAGWKVFALFIGNEGEKEEGKISNNFGRKVEEEKAQLGVGLGRNKRVTIFVKEKGGGRLGAVKVDTGVKECDWQCRNCTINCKMGTSDPGGKVEKRRHPSGRGNMLKRKKCA